MMAISFKGAHLVVYPNPADNAISAKTGKTAMTSATSSFKMAQGNALARFRRVRCSSGAFPFFRLGFQQSPV
jgi:hypothetical protein